MQGHYASDRPYICQNDDHRRSDFDRALKFHLDLKSLQEGIKLDPQNAPAFLFRGLILQQQGKEVDAKADFDRALKLQPELKAILEEQQRKAKKDVINGLEGGEKKSP